MQITGAWIKAGGVQAVLRLLADAGHQAFLVGGCVRNALINQPVADIDIATDAMPDRVVNLAISARMRVVPTGIDHGTVTIVIDGAPHEVTTFRRDVTTDGRRATVAFTTDIKEDAARRDLTMNALYATADGQVIDPLDGLDDLMARRVRFVGSADERIREDYLRILRFFRFHAWYGDPDLGMDADGLAACAKNSAGLEALSRERVSHEMQRLLAAPDPAPTVASMQATGVLARILPGADARSLAPLVHLEQSLSPSWLRRLVALGGARQDAALRLSRDDARQLSVMCEAIGTMTGPEELAYRHGQDLARDVVLLRAAILETPLAENWQAKVTKGATAVFPVTSADLMPEIQGKALGLRLKSLESRWIASGFELSREQLLA
ncbi:MAG: CCA tRNA nucleotidyltransferase [Albidovulum sp.]